jgi:sulfide:quinone oxidoreductase
MYTRRFDEIGRDDLSLAGGKGANLGELSRAGLPVPPGFVVLGSEPELAFRPTSMCVMEQFDKATFAQVPLRLTGVPERPVEVDTEALDGYKVGSSPAWRLGKKALGYYLPFRFGLGNPFHAGLPWKGMETGLKAMSGLLAK